MNDKSPPKGASPEEVTPQQLISMWEQVIAGELPSLAGTFAPHVSTALCRQLAPIMAKEQFAYASQMIPMYMGTDRDTAPTFAVRIFRTENDVPGGKPLADSEQMVVAWKRIDLSSPDGMLRALFTVMLMSFATSPAMRALLRMHGLHYDFVQFREGEGPADKPKIHLVKG